MPTPRGNPGPVHAAPPLAWSASTHGATVLHTLHPGDVALAERGERLETLLGSCIAILMTDPRRSIGAMCHIVHAAPPNAASCRPTAHAEPALAAMYLLLRARGIEPAYCDAYVYGGGNMFPSLFREHHVGEANACWALDALERDGVRVLHHELGGTTYRRVGWTVGPRAPLVHAIDI